MDEPLINTLTPSHDPAADKTDKFQLTSIPLKTPFGKIAMALSGGGFRAASFSIGAMSYLRRVQYGEGRSLLDNVEFISSASGGTFPGILYSAYAKKGIPFEKVYQDMLSFMEGETLLEDVLRLLNDDKSWEGEEKNRNLINAFAKIYDAKLFKGETFGVYWGKGIGAAGAGAREIEVCFNATEFVRGLSFRWQTNGGLLRDKTFDAGKTGNGYIYIDKRTQTHLETLQGIKLGDIMASSSCFPGGFEPIVYPEDFSYSVLRDGKQGGQGLSSDKLKQAVIVTDYDNEPRILDGSIGLMDGGVDDNQGLYSAILADTRRRKSDEGNGFDLIMVTDVASYFMDPYLPPKPEVKGGWRKKNVEGILKDASKIMSRANKWIKIVFLLGLIMLGVSVALLVQHEEGPWRNIGFFLLSPAIILLLLWMAALVGKRFVPQIGRLSAFLDASDKAVLNSLKEQLPAAGVLSDSALGSLTKYLKQARFSVLEQMLKTRLNSTLSMVMDINLKQTRRLIFDIFFGNFYGQDVWVNRRAFNVIYELSAFNKASREKSIRNKFPGDAAAQSLLLDGCLELNAVAEEARAMGTTLWYDHTDAKEKKLMKVVSCGQFTTCGKLLEYVLDLEQTMKEEAGMPEGQRTIQLLPEARVEFDKVKAQLLEDWGKFKSDPYFLYKEMDK
ncbi:MAG TPA: patatin-like phospholipase family protein [Puia sp.]|nr:patatin-like phospholipase family protein [Puia sp.]